MDWIRLLKAVGTVSLCIVYALTVIVVMAKGIDLFIAYANEGWFIAAVLFLFVAVCVAVAYLSMD